MPPSPPFPWPLHFLQHYLGTCPIIPQWWHIAPPRTSSTSSQNHRPTRCRQRGPPPLGTCISFCAPLACLVLLVVYDTTFALGIACTSPISSSLSIMCSFTSFGHISKRANILHKSRTFASPLPVLWCSLHEVLSKCLLRHAPYDRRRFRVRVARQLCVSLLALTHFSVRIHKRAVVQDLLSVSDSARLSCMQHSRRISIQSQHGRLDLPRPIFPLVFASPRVFRCYQSLSCSTAVAMTASRSQRFEVHLEAVWSAAATSAVAGAVGSPPSTVAVAPPAARSLAE